MSKLTIPFTQFMRPDGRKVLKTFEIEDVDGSLKATVERCFYHGLEFEAEVLMDDTTCSFTITHPMLGDLFITLCPNGPQVPGAIERMIREAATDLDEAMEAAAEA